MSARHDLSKLGRLTRSDRQGRGGRLTLTGVVEEEGVIRPGILHEPMHCSQDILLGGLAHGILLVISENNHILATVTKVLDEVVCHVATVIDASSQLATLAKIVDSDEESFATAGTIGVAEGITVEAEEVAA